MTGLSELFQHNRELSTQRGRGSDLPKEWAKPSGSTINNCHHWQPETIAFRQFHMIPLYMLHRCYCHTLSYTYDQHLNPAWSLCTSSQATKTASQRDEKSNFFKLLLWNYLIVYRHINSVTWKPGCAFFTNTYFMAKKTMQWFRAFAILAEDTGSVSRTMEWLLTV